MIRTRIMIVLGTVFLFLALAITPANALPVTSGSRDNVRNNAPISIGIDLRNAYSTAHPYWDALVPPRTNLSWPTITSGADGIFVGPGYKAHIQEYILNVTNPYQIDYWVSGNCHGIGTYRGFAYWSVVTVDILATSAC